MLDDLLQEAAQARSVGNNQQAALIYEQAIKICEEGQNRSEQLAICLQELATIYNEQKLYDRVVLLYKKLVGLGSKILGENHPDVINAAVQLARALEANRQFTQADEIFKLAAGRAERALGLSHPLAQEIRQEYFELLSNREGIDQDETLKLGLVPLPANNSDRSDSSNKRVGKAGTYNAPPQSSVPVAGADTAAEKPKPTVSIKKVTGQHKKIKKLRYGAESAQEEAANLLNFQALRYRWRSLMYFGSVILCIAAITISLSGLLVPVHISAANLIGEQLIVKGSFQSADNNRGIQFVDNRFATLATDVEHRKIPYFLLKGSMSDLWAVFMSTIITRESWYQFAGDELIGEDGTVLYSGGSPEFVVVNKMRAFSDIAKHYYESHSCYPDKTEKLTGAYSVVYINPFDDKPETPAIKRASGNFGRDNILAGVKPDATVSDCYNFLRSGGSWREEAFPGKISALAFYSSQRCADGYKVSEFYIHGYDRHSKLITSGQPQNTYVIGMYNGRNLNDESREHLQAIEQIAVHLPRRIYIVPGSSTNLQFMHQLGGSILTGIVILCAGLWVIFGLRPRVDQPDEPMSIYPIDIIFGISVIFWLISFIIHLYG